MTTQEIEDMKWDVYWAQIDAAKHDQCYLCDEPFAMSDTRVDIGDGEACTDCAEAELEGS